MLTPTAIDDVRFAVTKFREGYAQAEVDAFLGEARLAIADWELRHPAALHSADIADRRFPVSKFGNGYDQDQVDDFLDLVAASLRQHESGAAAAPVAAPPVAATAPVAPAARPAPLADLGKLLRASSIADTSFTRVKWREGYSIAGVDDFLATAREVLAGYERDGVPAGPIPLTAEDVVNVRFQPTKFRAGYAQDEVDNYLDEIVAAVRAHERAAERS